MYTFIIERGGDNPALRAIVFKNDVDDKGKPCKSVASIYEWDDASGAAVAKRLVKKNYPDLCKKAGWFEKALRAATPAFIHTPSSIGPQSIEWRRAKSLSDCCDNAERIWGHWSGSAVYIIAGVFYVNDGFDPNDCSLIAANGDLPAGAYIVKP